MDERTDLSPSAPSFHSPDVSFGPPPDGPPPYSSNANDTFVGDVRHRVPDSRETGVSLPELALLMRGGEPSEETRKRYNFMKRVVTLGGIAILVLFFIIVSLLVVLFAKKENPVCNLSVPHSEALTVNILGEIQLAKEQAKADHRILQDRLSKIYSRHSNAIAGSLTKEIIEAKQNITHDFQKLERKFQIIYKKISKLQEDHISWNNSILLRSNYVVLSHLTLIALINYLFASYW